MKYQLTTENTNKAQVIAIPVFGNLAAKPYKSLNQQLERFPLDTAVGSVRSDLPKSNKEPITIAWQCSDNLNTTTFAKAAKAIANALIDADAKSACIDIRNLKIEKRDCEFIITQLILAINNATYQFSEFKKPHKIALNDVSFLVKEISKPFKNAIKSASAIADGMNFCKDLGNMPANICNPSYLAKQANRLARQFDSIKTNVLDEAQMKKLGMNTLLAVTKGSTQPAKLICMQYMGGKTKDKPIVFVGKGVTFDTGGNWLKQKQAMNGMKYDMLGAATLFGLIHAAASLKLALNIVVIVPSVENVCGGPATFPEDIVTSMSGKTIEILNTDAEGRLILCDALTYAAKYKPKMVIDVATLTGAVMMSFGTVASGVMGNDQNLVNDLLKAGDKQFDRAWQLPLYPEYHDELKSNIADLRNIGYGLAGSAMAATFLSNFTEDYTWAHLDIAGSSGTNLGTVKNREATGRPVALLVQFLLDQIN